MDSPYSSSLLPDLKTLETMPFEALKPLYEGVFGLKAPSRCSRLFLRGNLYWAQQAQAQGDDPVTLRKRLHQGLSDTSAQPKTQYQPGTRLIREWQGEVHEVVVLEKGFRWQGQHYASLSRIASQITGVHWSGPRFFGLTSRK